MLDFVVVLLLQISLFTKPSNEEKFLCLLISLIDTDLSVRCMKNIQRTERRNETEERTKTSEIRNIKQFNHDEVKEITR